MKNTIIPLCIAMIFAVSCQKNKPLPEKSSARVDSLFGIVMADTIIYDVVIKNDNPDDTWATERLGNLNRTELINDFFDMIYHQQATAYDHTSGEKLTPAQVRKLEAEPGFSRNDISMIQFKECWYLDPATARMHKKVISMVLGAAVYTSMGEFKANRAILRIELND